MAKPIEYGKSSPSSSFDKRANDKNPPDATTVKGKTPAGLSIDGKQTKGFGAASKR